MHDQEPAWNEQIHMAHSKIKKGRSLISLFLEIYTTRHDDDDNDDDYYYYYYDSISATEC